MIRSTLLRRFVSSIAIFMLVWCQTSAATQGIAIPAPATEATTSAPCHQTTTDRHNDTTQQTDCQTRCQSHNAWFEIAKIHLPAIDDLPIVLISTALFAAVATYFEPKDQTTERAAPPPLILIYGRLLI